VRQAFPSWHRSTVTEFSLWHACADQEVEDGNGLTGGAPVRGAGEGGAVVAETTPPIDSPTPPDVRTRANKPGRWAWGWGCVVMIRTDDEIDRIVGEPQSLIRF
jgi:hypothetical protein